MNLPEEEATKKAEADIKKAEADTKRAEEQSRQAEEQRKQAEANLKKAEEIKNQVLLEREANRKATVQFCQRQNLSKQETISMLKNELMIEQTEATKVCEQYWKNEN